MSSDSREWAEMDGAVRLDGHDPYLRLQSVTVFVRDLDRSLDFYVNQLGFQLAFDGRAQRQRPFVAVAPPDGSANLTLAAPGPDSDQYKLIGRSTQITFITENVLAKFSEWRKRGVPFLSTPRLRRLKQAVHSDAAPIWGGVFARFRDPDGNSFSLVSFDEMTRAVEAQRRAVAERLEAERRVAQELEIATQVQARLFPQSLPSCKTLECAGLCIPARKVGGDYYDFLNLGGGRVGLVVGDVVGKGIAAALLMANLQAYVRSLCTMSLDEPQRWLRSVNTLFTANTPDGDFATMFFAEYDDNSRRLRYANCGHMSALLLRSDATLEKLDSTATVLGLFPEWECTVQERQLLCGDTLALYTDGITESFNEADEEFGESRLIAAMRRNQELSSQALLTSIVDEVQRFSPHEQHDDITLIVAKCNRD